MIFRPAHRPSRLVFALAASLLLIGLSGCATNTLQRAGSSDLFDMQLDSQLDWARTKGSRNESWTIDGSSLNLLRIYSGVKPNEHVFMARKEKASKPDGPWFRPGMRPDELRDLILDGLREQGSVNVEAEGLRPHRFGTTDGVRFDIQMSSADGLNYKGTVAVVERNGLLTSLVWSAPTEHYYDRDAAAVNRMLDSMRFVR